MPLNYWIDPGKVVILNFQEVLQAWLTSFLNFLPNIISAIVIFILTVWAANALAKAVRKISRKRIESEEVTQLIARIVRWSLLAIGTVVALGQVNFNVTGFIAGLGVAGFTIGFALQDIAKNFISGLMLLYRQPFNLGDWVKVSDYSGSVEDINVRDTVIRTKDGELVIIPNKDVFEAPIINYTHSALRRQTVMIGLGYEEDSERAITAFLDAIRAVPGVEQDPEPVIRAEALGESALTLAASFWVNQNKANILDVHSEAVKAIKRAADQSRINLPYPIQIVHLETRNQD